ncbi:MAG: methyltransferase [Sandaracinaceae bacterium]
MATGYVPFAVVSVAVELGLFEALSEPRDTEAVAGILGADADGVGRLLRALVALEIVERDERGWFSCPHAAVLARDADAGALLLHHRRHVAPMFLQLGSVLERGGRPHRAWEFAGPEPAPGLYDELARHPGEFDLFMRAMDRGGRGVGAHIAEAEDLTGCDRVLDLGGGGGAVARELLACVPGLSVVSVDLAPACVYGRERAASTGLRNRHVFREGDLRALPSDLAPAEVVLLAGVLADFPPDERALVMRQATSCLRPGGRLLVSETLLNSDRTSPVSAALLSLMTYAAFGGDQLSREDVAALFESVGLEWVAHHERGERGRDLVVGRL